VVFRNYWVFICLTEKYIKIKTKKKSKKRAKKQKKTRTQTHTRAAKYIYILLGWTLILLHRDRKGSLFVIIIIILMIDLWRNTSVVISVLGFSYISIAYRWMSTTSIFFIGRCRGNLNFLSLLENFFFLMYTRVLLHERLHHFGYLPPKDESRELKLTRIWCCIVKAKQLKGKQWFKK